MAFTSNFQMESITNNIRARGLLFYEFFLCVCFKILKCSYLSFKSKTDHLFKLKATRSTFQFASIVLGESVKHLEKHHMPLNI